MNLFIKNIETLRTVIKVEAGFKFDSILPDLETAQETYIVRLLGREFTDSLALRYNTVAPVPALTNQEQTLIFHLQQIQAHAAAINSLPYMLVTLTNGGLSQIATAQRTSIFKWQKLEYQNAHLEDLFTGTENALIYLWANRDDAQFVQWKGSDKEKSSRSLFINSAEEFHSYYEINNSRRTFESMRSIITDSMVKIKRIIGKQLFSELQTQISTFALTDPNKALLPYINIAITRAVISKAINRLPLLITGEGIMVTNAQVNFADSPKNQTAATSDQLVELKAEALSSYSEKIGELQEFLKDNLGDYPLYADSDEYKKLTSCSNINSCENKSVIL